jgi:hypothetical protein
MSLLICIEASSQELPSLKKYDISRYNKRLCRKLKNLDCARRNESRSVIFIYHLKLNGKVDKEGFNASYLKSNLSFIENPDAAFPSNMALIYNDSLRLVASSDDLRVFCEYQNKYFQALLTLTLTLSSSFDFLFRISGTNGVIYFGSRKGEISVIDPIAKKIYLLDEFIDCCWESLYPK